MRKERSRIAVLIVFVACGVSPGATAAQTLVQSGERKDNSGATGGAAGRDPVRPPTVRPLTEVARSWTRRAESVLASEVPAWRQNKAREIRDDLERLLPGVTDAEAMELLSVLEFVQWSQRDNASAEAYARRRYSLGEGIHAPDALAQLAYEQGSEFSARGLDDAARFHYSQVSRLAPTHRQAVIADHNVGVILRRSNRFKEGEQCFLDFVAKYRASQPEYARRAQYLAGDCAWRGGDAARALELFQAVTREYPGTPEADGAKHMVKDINNGERPEDGIRAGKPSRMPSEENTRDPGRTP